MKCPSCGAETSGDVCEYCGSELPKEKSTVNVTNNYYGNSGQESNQNSNTGVTCPQCGGNKIKFNRERVGTSRQGQSKSTIRLVGTGRTGSSTSQTAYRTVGICQNCGYTWDATQGTGATAKKKSRTWLWVLGWICIFPIPLTILMLRNEKLDKKIRYAIIAIAWIVYIAIGASGGGEKEEVAGNTTAVIESEQATETIDEATATEQETSEESETAVNQYYENDDVVNEFISAFNEKYPESAITDAEQGNIKQKAYGHIDGVRVEMLNSYGAAAENYNMSVYGGNTDEATEAMFEAFEKVVTVLNPDLSDEQVNELMTYLTSQEYMVEDYEYEGLVITYVPSKELSYGKNDSRLDIASSTFGKEKVSN